MSPRTPSSRRHAHARGGSILEVVIAMAVLALAGAGAVTGMVTASRHVHDGQLFQVKRQLVEARAQRLWLASKQTLLNEAVDRPAPTPAPELAPGTAPWRVDPSPAVAGDPGSGAYFMLSATGEVTPPDYAIPPGTPCDSSQLRAGTYCREVLVTRGLPADVPANVGALLPAGARPVTVWTRVMRVGEGAEDAVLHNEVFVQ